MTDVLTVLNANPAWLVGLSALLGLLFGSFLNVVIYRLPIMMETRWRTECEEMLEPENARGDSETFNLLTPRSRCPQCGVAVSALSNVPVFSWLWLRGKCANCRAPISVQYPTVELITGLASAVVIAHFGATAAGGAALILTWALVALSGIDFNTTLLPDDITLPLLWLGLIANLFFLYTDLQSAVLGAVFGYLSLWLVYQGFKLITGKEGMGFGDFKLLAALGAWLGWQYLPLVILVSSLLGAIVGISLMLILGRDRNVPIPFGPYLAFAGWICLIWGSELNALYLGSYGG